MPRTPHSPLIAAYAAERGVPMRTAQHRFKKMHPDVVDWLARNSIVLHSAKKEITPVQALAAVERMAPREGGVFSMTASAAPRPAAMDKPDGMRTVEEHAECETWSMFSAAANATREAAKANDIQAAGFARTAVECLKAYIAAKAAREKAEIDSRKLIPSAEFDMLIADVVQITNAWKQMGPKLAAEIDPANPSRIVRIFERFTESSINPLTESMMAA